MEKTIVKMAVVGAGTMGAAIAACGARAGLDVVLMVRGKGEESGRVRAAKAVEQRNDLGHVNHLRLHRADNAHNGTDRQRHE